MDNFTVVQIEHLPALVDRLRTALAQAEAERDALRGDTDVTMAILTANALQARAEKAEAERDDVMRHAEKMMLRTEAAEARAEKAEAQLPEGMKHCTIIFRECALGHGWLTATNWAPFECPTCAIQAERARADRYLAAIVEYVEATAAEEQAEEAYTSFGSRMMDRSLPPVTEEDVKAAFTTVANARNRAYAATTAIRAIVEERFCCSAERHSRPITIDGIGEVGRVMVCPYCGHGGEEARRG